MLMKKTKRMLLCLLFLVAAVLLSGCLKMHIDIVWKENNSGTVSMTFGVTNTALSMMGMSEAEIQAQFRESLQEGDDYSIRDYKDNDYTGIVATLDVDDITRGSSFATDQMRFRCSEEGRVRTYTVSGNYVSSDVMGDTGDLEDFGVSFADIDMKMSITMPGRIISHNATEQKGNKLIWDLTGSAVTSIEAKSEARGGGAWIWIIIIIVLIAAGVVVFLFLRKKKADAAQGVPGQQGAYYPSTPGYQPYQAPPGQFQPQAAPTPDGYATQPVPPMQAAPAPGVYAPPPPVAPFTPEPYAPPPPAVPPASEPYAPPHRRLLLLIRGRRRPQIL